MLNFDFRNTFAKSNILQRFNKTKRKRKKEKKKVRKFFVAVGLAGYFLLEDII